LQGAYRACRPGDHREIARAKVEPRRAWLNSSSSN
jgi:hypothetical protein